MEADAHYRSKRMTNLPSDKPRVGRRHFFIPDTQIHKGVGTKHIDFAARAIVKYKPDVIIVIGDWWDMPSLSSYDVPGSKKTRHQSVKRDIDVGNEAFERFVAPMNAYRKLHKDWKPDCHFFFGNHEDRLTRYLETNPKMDGILSLDLMKTPGFKRHDFLKIVSIDGVHYSHYFQNVNTSRPIGGSIQNRLAKIGVSFVQGHTQGFNYARQEYPGGLARNGLVAGSFYTHNEDYRGPQGQGEWRGVIVLNGVRNGDYNIMPLDMDYLRATFG